MELLAKHFGCTRFVYNYFLNQRQEQYKKEGESDNYYAQAKALTELKKKEEYLKKDEVKLLLEEKKLNKTIPKFWQNDEKEVYKNHKIGKIYI